MSVLRCRVGQRLRERCGGREGLGHLALNPRSPVLPLRGLLTQTPPPAADHLACGGRELGVSS